MKLEYILFTKNNHSNTCINFFPLLKEQMRTSSRQLLTIDYARQTKEKETADKDIGMKANVTQLNT